jgi:hypothetical protein
MNNLIEAYHALIQSSLAQGEKEIAEMYANCIREEISGGGSGPYRSEKGRFHFHFNWKGGGFNSAWGQTKEEALKEVKARFGIGYEVDESSLRVYTDREERNHDRSMSSMWN